MATAEKSNSHIQQILTAFHHFVLLYERDTWLKNATTETIISGFKCASFVEGVIKSVKEKETADDLIGVLNYWWGDVKGRTKVYDAGFYEFACDRLLGKFFFSGLSSGDCTDVAVRVYTRMTSKERLERVLKSIMLKAGSFEAIIEHVIENKNIYSKQKLDEENIHLDKENKVNTTTNSNGKHKNNVGKSRNLNEKIKNNNKDFEKQQKPNKTKSNINLEINLTKSKCVEDLEVRLLYENWLDEYSKGNKVLIENHIESMLTCYKLEKSLFLLISILSFENVHLQNVILKKLEPKMSDRSSLSKKFWTALWKNVKLEQIIKACVSSEYFFDLFFNFFEYLVTMVSLNSDGAWVIDPNVDCIEITYYELSVVVRAFYNEQKLRDYVVKRIKDAKNKIGTPIWEEFFMKIIDGQDRSINE